MTGNSDVEMKDAEKLTHVSETYVHDSAKGEPETKNEDGECGVSKDNEAASQQTCMDEQNIQKGEGDDLVSEKNITRLENEQRIQDPKEEIALSNAEEEQNNAKDEVTEKNVMNCGAEEQISTENGIESMNSDKSLKDKLNEEVMKEKPHEIGGEDADCGTKITGSAEPVQNANSSGTRQSSTPISVKEVPPGHTAMLHDVPRGEDENMEDAAGPHESYPGKDEVKEISIASPGANGKFATLETVVKLGHVDTSLPSQFESATPISPAISTLMVGDGDGTPEDQILFMKELESFYQQRTMDFKPPKFYGQPLNCLKLWRAVIRLGGYDRVTGAKLWRQVGESFHPPKTCTTVSWTFRIFYEKALLEYEKHKIRCGELQFGTETLTETPGADVEGNGILGSVSGRVRRDAAARAMQGWHSQRKSGYGEVSEPVIKDKNAINIGKREKNLEVFGSGKQKRPKDHSMKALRSETSRQLVTSVIDVGPPAEWVKVNVLQAKDCYEVYALVPGLVREEVRVQSDPAGRLVITGQPEQADNPWGVTSFKKVISLPTKINPFRTSAVVSLHGGLFVHVPFEESDL